MRRKPSEETIVSCKSTLVLAVVTLEPYIVCVPTQWVYNQVAMPPYKEIVVVCIVRGCFLFIKDSDY